MPGNVPKFIDKAHERGADCILVDLEDSVTVAEKPTARAMLPETMKKVVRGGADVAVRINRPMRLAIPDIEAAVRPGLAALFITKTEGVQHLRLLDEAVSEMERERGMPVGSVGFGAMIEHPRALAELNDIAERGPRVIAMMLGGEDFALETGSVPSDESLELPKRLVAFAAQAHGVAMIGILGTVADYSDPAAYKKSAERARRFGFSGGTCVHPGLVQALNEAFTPSADDVAYAKKLIAADEKAAAEGRGSFTVDGKMIDIPVIDRARRLIARYDAIERRLRRVLGVDEFRRRRLEAQDLVRSRGASVQVTPALRLCSSTSRPLPKRTASRWACPVTSRRVIVTSSAGPIEKARCTVSLMPWRLRRAPAGMQTAVSQSVPATKPMVPLGKRWSVYCSSWVAGRER